MPKSVGAKRLLAGIACAVIWMHLLAVPLRAGSSAAVMVLHALAVAGMLLAAGRFCRTVGSAYAHLENVSVDHVTRQVTQLGIVGFLFGALGSGLGVWALMATIARDGAGLTALLAAGTAGVLVVAGYARGDELRRRDGALLLALAAGWILCCVGRDGILWQAGIIMAGACVGLMALGWTVRYSTGRGDVFTGVAAVQVLAAVWVVFFGLGQGNLDGPGWWGGLVLILAAGVHVAALTLIYQACRDLGIAPVARADALTPAGVVLLGLLLGTTQMSIPQWCGGILVVLACYGLAQLHPRRLLTGRSPAPRRMHAGALASAGEQEEVDVPEAQEDLELDSTEVTGDDDGDEDDDITLPR